MMYNTEVRVCKKCQKVLPADCKYRYCEACRNQLVDTAKKYGVKGLVAACATGIAIALVTRNNNSKE